MLNNREREVLEKLLAMVGERNRRDAMRLFYKMYPYRTTTHPDGSVFHARNLYPKHMEFFEAGASYRERCFMAGNRIGKALRNGTPVATPRGYVSIEDLKVGDLVIAGDGSAVSVTGVYPQGEVDLFKVGLDGGQVIFCCGDHLWKYQHPRARYPDRRSHGATEPNPFYGEWSVGSTRDILAAVGEKPRARRRVVLPDVPVWDLPDVALPIDPYAFGILLGDGHFGSENLMLSTGDVEIVEAVRAAVSPGCEVNHVSRYDYRIKRVGGSGSHPIMECLRVMGLHGVKGPQKFIPQDYLLAGVDQRLALLRGLMDSDGSITKHGSPEFSTTSCSLAHGVKMLVESLGGRAILRDRQTHCNGKAALPSYRVSVRMPICPFLLARKADRWKQGHRTYGRVIHSIVPAGRGEATCISVDHPDRTFVTEHGTVTHNTMGAGGYEVACHLTGQYPSWWQGRRFEKAPRVWVAGKTNETTRDIVQTTLLGTVQSKAMHNNGNKGFTGEGLVPGELLGPVSWKQGVTDLADLVKVKHKSGKWASLGIKSYQQGRGSFEGTAQHVIWLDEEPPLDVYGECLTRTMTVGGIVLMTFTPLEGMSETVLQFLPGSQQPEELAKTA